MKKISKCLYKKTNLKIMVIAFIVFVVFTAAVMPVISNFTAMVTSDAQSPDLSLIYKADDLYQMAEDYGAYGRKMYIVLRFTFDLVWPLVYLFFMLALTTTLLSNIQIDSKLRLLNVFPIIGAVFDYLENIGAAVVMGRYPMRSDIIAQLTPIATLLKWIFIGAAFVLIIVLAVYRIVRYFMSKNKA